MFQLYVFVRQAELQCMCLQLCKKYSDTELNNDHINSAVFDAQYLVYHKRSLHY